MEYDHAFLPLGKGMIWDGLVKSWEEGRQKIFEVHPGGGGGVHWSAKIVVGRGGCHKSFLMNPESNYS